MSSSHIEGSYDPDETIETDANTDGNAENVYFTEEVFELKETDACRSRARLLEPPPLLDTDSVVDPLNS